MSDTPLSCSLAALSQYFVGGATMRETLHQVADLATKAIPGADFVGLTMMVNGKPATAVFTDPTSPEIDQAQYSSGRGPCLQAFVSGRTVVIESTDRDTRWPEFSRACVDHGIHSTLSLPLAVDGCRAFGGFNVYSSKLDAFGPTEVADGLVFAAHASIVLANAQAYTDALTLTEQLNEAITSRQIIEQAKGIIMATMCCDADEAFDHLVQQSQHMNIKLRVLAEGIVKDTSRLRLSSAAQPQV